MSFLNEFFEGLPNLLLSAFFLAGLIGLVAGGNWLLRGAISLAAIFRIQPVIIGLTIVSAATSMPEFFTSLLGAIQGSDGLAIGNIVGSNIANIGLILGISALIAPLAVGLRLIRIDVPVLVGVSILFAVLSFGILSRIDGLILLLVAGGYLFFLVRNVRKNSAGQAAIEAEIGDQLEQGSLVAAICWILLGTAGLAVGADLLVRSSVEFAARLGVNELLIGLTVVAIGTSLPELAASIVAAARKQADLCVGNIVGSNLFNLLFVGGLVALVSPVEADLKLFRIEFPFMIGFALLLWPFAVSGKRISRREGFLLLIFYAVFLILSSFFQLRG